MMNDNMVLPFQIEGQPFRGRLVRLGSVLDTILKRHDNKKSISALLGEAVSITAALGTAFKTDGVFTLQARGEGEVALLVADVTSDGAVRGYAQPREGIVTPEGASLLGKGYLAFTMDQTLKDERYQGIVEREGDDISAAVQHYFRQSEQVPTAILAAASQGEDGAWRGGCLMLQRVALEGGKNAAEDTAQEDDWHRAMLLMQTCSREELTDPLLPAEDLLFRLFHQEGVRVFETVELRHTCRCSRQKVQDVLTTLPDADIEHLLEDGKVSAHCEFCNETYVFTKEDIEKIRAAHPKE